MPKRLRHRGADPEDLKAFDATARPMLKQAISDLCWLLDHGYALPSAAELVGNRYKLTLRQRMALGRCACARTDTEARSTRELQVSQLAGQELWIDGFNVLTAIETALAGGIILIGADGCCRDIAGVHRRYTRVQETTPAIELVGEWLSRWELRKTVWWLDSPVANSGRLKSILLNSAKEHSWDWAVELVPNPDRVLSASPEVVATADRVILQRCGRWFNLARHVIAARIPQARIVDFGSA